MLRRLSVRNSLLGILALLGCSYLLLLLMVQMTARSTQRHMETVSSVLFPATLTLQQVKYGFDQTNKHYKDAVLLEDAKGLQTAENDADANSRMLETLTRQLQPTPELFARAVSLQQHQASLNERARVTYPRLLNGKDLTDGLQADLAALARDNAALQVEINGLGALLEDRGRAQFSAVDRVSWILSVTGAAFLIVSLVGFSAAWWIVQYKVVRPLEALRMRMQDIAEGQGDLTDRMEVKGNDELDDVGRWFNIFIERIEHVIVRVAENGKALSGAARALAGEAQEAATQTSLQQGEAVNITLSMNDISLAARAISTNTHKAAEDARKAQSNARDGGAIIRSTVDVIESLLLSNRTTSAKLAELGEASNNIEKAVRVIYDISRQASLLALNASIEAARAGEHGRGFAVVAEEVRRLSESTARNTLEIEQTVSAIQQGTQEAMQAMSATTREVEEGVRRALSAGEALSSILQGSEAVHRMVTQIATASTEQSAAAQAVHLNLEEIASLGSRAARSSARTVTSCDHLSEMAANLNGLVGSFKVGPALTA